MKLRRKVRIRNHSTNYGKLKQTEYLILSEKK